MDATASRRLSERGDLASLMMNLQTCAPKLTARRDPGAREVPALSPPRMRASRGAGDGAPAGRRTFAGATQGAAERECRSAGGTVHALFLRVRTRGRSVVVRLQLRS